jgi:hypothetical protein
VPVLGNESLEQETRLSVTADFASVGPVALSAGVEAVRAEIDAEVFQRAVPGGPLASDLSWQERLATAELAAFGQAGVAVGDRLDLSAGLRVDRVTVLDDGLELSPRASARLELGGGLAAQVGVGLYHQAPGLLTLSVRDNGVRVNRTLRQQRNRQVAGGLSWLPNAGLRITLEGFRKTYSRVPVLRSDPRISLANLGGDYGFVGAEPLADDGTGRATGLELFAQQKLTGRFYLLAAYTLSRSEFAGADGVLRPSAWDRRHALDLTSGYRIGSAWEVGVKLRVLSGLATTPWDRQASSQQYPVTGRGVPDWSRIGEVRTPAYARLDVRGERRISFPGWNAVIYLDLQNVLNRANVVGFTYTEDPAFPDRSRPIDGAGLLPTFGFSIEF